MSSMRSNMRSSQREVVRCTGTITIARRRRMKMLCNHSAAAGNDGDVVVDPDSDSDNEALAGRLMVRRDEEEGGGQGGDEDDKEAEEFAVSLARVAWETKGEDLLLLHVAPVVYWTRYMLFVTVFSRPQLNAILAKTEQLAFEKYDRRPASAATGRSSWELLDFGDVVVHVLTAEEREYYDLVRCC